MSCDRCWKLLLGGFRSLFQRFCLSRVKSKLSDLPDLLYLPSLCYEVIVSYGITSNPNTHTSTQTSPSSLSPALLSEMSHSIWILNRLSGTSKLFCSEIFLLWFSADKRSTQKNTLDPFPLLTATLCLIMWFISEGRSWVRGEFQCFKERQKNKQLTANLNTMFGPDSYKGTLWILRNLFFLL